MSDGKLDDLYFFMLPEKVKLISLARERDPAYGRELSDWVSEVGGVVLNAPQPVSNADSLKGGCISTGEAVAQRSCAQGTARPTEDAPIVDNRPQSVVNAEADRLWEEARGMAHNFIPDPATDGDYLAKVYEAARLGHLEAMVKLGDYAYRRGAVVEAFYWTFLAELNGATGLEDALCEMRTQWLSEGCPEEYENAYTEFSEEQGVFARAVLRLQCDVNPQYALVRLTELAEQGCAEARLFLG